MPSVFIKECQECCALQVCYAEVSGPRCLHVRGLIRAAQEKRGEIKLVYAAADKFEEWWIKRNMEIVGVEPKKNIARCAWNAALKSAV